MRATCAPLAQEDVQGLWAWWPKAGLVPVISFRVTFLPQAVVCAEAAVLPEVAATAPQKLPSCLILFGELLGLQIFEKLKSPSKISHHP